MKRVLLFVIAAVLSISVMTGCVAEQKAEPKTGSDAEQQAELKTGSDAEQQAETKTGSDAETKTEPKSEKSTFTYIHDPRDNPEAMADIVENDAAVYGFAPDPKSERLGPFAQYDWTDPKFVAEKKEERSQYHKSQETMMDILYKMRDEGASLEEMARAVSEERNRLRIESYKDDPETFEKMKESNLKTYGREEGPTPDELYEKYGSWEAVLQKSFSPNMGMDACCGLYDDYYFLYVELGYVK